MAHINDLDTPILYRILWFASGELATNIDKWKRKLYLLQVCTKWYDLFKGYVFSRGFVDIYPLDYNAYPKVDLNSCVYYADNIIVCRSNLGIITGRDEYNCDCVSELKIIVHSDTNISQCFHVLKELLTLGVGYWLNLSSLSFFNHSNHDNSFLFKEIGLEEITTTASNYIHDLQNRLPNVTNLGVYLNMDFILKTTFYILVEHYAPHLQLLHLSYSIKQPLPQFSTKLTSLSLNLLNYTDQRPSFYAKSLQYLKLNISSSKFSWWIFHDFTTPGRIEFTNLKTLDLSYKPQTDKEQKLSEKYSKQARPYGTHMLRFPKLENLTLWYPPVDCDVFYTDTIPTHLKKLVIGSCDSVAAASKLRFKSVNKMHISIFKEETPNNEFYIAADRYFGYTKIGSTCEVYFGSPFDIQRTVSWVNVTEIEFSDIVFNELMKLIPNLYSLRTLEVNNIHFDKECLSIIRSGLEEEEMEDFELLDTRIKRLEMYYTEPNDPRLLLAFLNHFLLRTTTLKTVELLDNDHLSVVDGSFLPEKFPHINFTC